MEPISQLLVPPLQRPRSVTTNTTPDAPQTASTLAANEHKLNHSFSHSFLSTKNDKQKGVNTRASVLRPQHSSSDVLSTNKQERLQPRPAGSANILRKPSLKKDQGQDGLDSHARHWNGKKGERASCPKDEEGPGQWRKILWAASKEKKAAYLNDHAEIGIIEALEPSRTIRRYSAEAIDSNGDPNTKAKRKESEKNIAPGSAGGNGKPYVKPKKKKRRGPKAEPDPTSSKPILSTRPSALQNNDGSNDIDSDFSILAPTLLDEESDKEGHSLLPCSDTSEPEMPTKKQAAKMHIATAARKTTVVPKIDKRATAGKANNTASSNGAVIGSTKPAIVVQEPILDSRSSEEPTVQPEETRDIEDAQVINELNLCCDINTITPSIYDDLLPWMHSSSIARYAQSEGKISTDASSQARLTAATPTRIIAQITSDTFMDYELVSDFFLTFRPYLDAQKLVHLLFARLEWSMDRHTADGRIVRIRTFAALRHWVLNYFADDFLHENSGLELRKAFCGRLNGLYRKMKNHMEAVTAQGGRDGTETSQAAIASDLKVLVDLKRCWNGRCAFFRDCFEKACKHEDSHLNMGEESFNADEDVMYNWSPSGTRYVSDDGAHPVIERTHLSRFNDTRFSYYGAYLPNDRLPLSTELPSASKLSSKSHPLLNERIHQDRGDLERNRSAVAASRKQDCSTAGDIRHAKSNSQGSNASVQSAGLSRRGHGHTLKNSGSFSDSTRHNVSQIRRSLSLKAKDHGGFPYDLVPFERQRYDSQRAVLKNKDEARVVVSPMLRLEESDPLPEQLQDEDSNGSAEIPENLKDTHIPYRQGMIHGVLFTPLRGVVHVLGDCSLFTSQHPTLCSSPDVMPLGLKEHVCGVDKKINELDFGALGDESQDDKRPAAPPAAAYPKSEASITASREPGDNSERPKSKVNFQEVRPESPSILHARPLSRRAPPVTDTRRNMTVPTMTTTITANPMPDNSHGPFSRRLRNRRTKDETAMNPSSIEPPSTTPGVKNLVGTIRRAFVDRKQVHDSNETMRSASAGTPAAAGLGILRTNSQSKTRNNQHNDTIADRFFRKRSASQSTSHGPPVQSGPTRQKSKEFKRGIEHDISSLSSRNNSLLVENTGYDDIINQNAKTFGTKTPPRTAAGLMSGRSFASSPQKGGSASHYSPQDADHIRWHRIVADEVTIKGQLMPFLLPSDSDKRKSVLEWLDSHKDPRVDILAEYAAQAYRYHLFFQHERHIQGSASITMASGYDSQDAQRVVPGSTVLDGREAIPSNLLVPSPSDTNQARDTDLAQPAPQGHNDASNPESCSQIHGKEASRASCYARTECGSNAPLDELQPNLVHSKAISGSHAGLGLNVDISSSEPPLGNAFPGLTNRASVLTVPAMEMANPDHEIAAGHEKTGRHASASYDGPVLEPTKSEPARAVSGNAFHRLLYQPSVSTRPSCQDELTAQEQNEDGGMANRASNCNLSPRRIVDSDAGKAGHFLQVTGVGRPQSGTGNNTIARGGWAVTRGMKSFGNKLRKYASYQSGMSKFGHASSNNGLQPHHEGRDLQESDGAVGPPPMSRSRSLWGIGRRRQDASDTVDKQMHGRILSHHPLNVSSFDVHAKIEECDREGAFSPMPNLPHIPPPPSVSSSSPSPSLLNERAAPGEEGVTPVYTLRRRPGGDLRHAQNVHDLVVQHVPSETPTSLGSSFSNSPYNSHDLTHFSKFDGTGESSFLEKENTGFVHDESEETTDGSIAQESGSQFQDAIDDQVGFTPVSEFTNAADGNDGGVESTLLKLEGKWARKPPTASRTKETFFPRSSFDSDDSLPGLDEKRHRRQQKVVDSVESLEHLSVASDYVSEAAGSRTERASSLASMYFNEGEEDVQPPTHAQQSKETADETETSQTHDNDLDNSPDGIESANTSKYLSASSKFSPAPVDASNLSSQMVSDPTNECGESGSGYDTTGIGQANGESSSQTPYQTPLEGLKKSFYSSKTGADGALDCEDSLRSGKAHENRDSHQDTLQPWGEDSSLVGASVHSGFGPPLAVRKYPHAPFILAYDPKVLAEQFTLVEIAALGEIDWRDLVDMNWSNEQSTLNWADYLATDGRRGIDIVVARFNLMVKWVVSEIVLTRQVHERARAISTFIHIATRARALRNYSTMVQITIALSSVDCMRLKKTWALVEDEDIQALREMESLVQPLRNFKDLRLEMESQGLQDACVPFVGLYVQDLTYNAQKPATVKVEGNHHGLVNLERYRSAASIVKNLLRLIDARTRYDFKPVNGLIQRCLWISALADADIRSRSKTLEQD